VLNQLLKIAPYLVESDKVDVILAHLVEMAHDESSNPNRMLAAETFGKTSLLFSMKVCESYICGELLSLGIDLNEFVREKAIE
jgi:serine/threonine-protein phosphatase 4 regulatory subunit 1